MASSMKTKIWNPLFSESPGLSGTSPIPRRPVSTITVTEPRPPTSAWSSSTTTSHTDAVLIHSQPFNDDNIALNLTTTHKISFGSAPPQPDTTGGNPKPSRPTLVNRTVNYDASVPRKETVKDLPKEIIFNPVSTTLDLPMKNMSSPQPPYDITLAPPIFPVPICVFPTNDHMAASTTFQKHQNQGPTTAGPFFTPSDFLLQLLPSSPAPSSNMGTTSGSPSPATSHHSSNLSTAGDCIPRNSQSSKTITKPITGTTVSAINVSISSYSGGAIPNHLGLLQPSTTNQPHATNLIPPAYTTHPRTQGPPNLTSGPPPTLVTALPSSSSSAFIHINDIVHQMLYENRCAACGSGFRLTSDLVYHIRASHPLLPKSNTQRQSASSTSKSSSLSRRRGSAGKGAKRKANPQHIHTADAGFTEHQNPRKVIQATVWHSGAPTHDDTTMVM